MILAIRRGNGSYSKNKKIEERDILMFLVCINTGLRIRDILKLKVKYVKEKDNFMIKEGKAKKKRVVNISMLRKEIDDYVKDKADHEYLFKSQRGEDRKSDV